MKKLWNPITIALFVGMTLGLFWAAVEGDFPPDLRAGVEKQGRIQVVERKTWEHPILYIVSVDGREFLVSGGGGIYPLDGKP